MNFNIGYYQIGNRSETNFFELANQFHDEVSSVFIHNTSQPQSVVDDQPKNVFYVELGKANQDNVPLHFYEGLEQPSVLKPSSYALNSYHSVGEAFLEQDVLGSHTFSTRETKNDRVTTLDTFLKDHPDLPSPDFISIHVEGTTLSILEGGAQALQFTSAVQLTVSLNNSYDQEEDFAMVDTWMKNHGFHFLKINKIFQTSPYRAPLGFRGYGMDSKIEVLYVKNFERFKSIPCEKRDLYILIHKLTFLSILLGQLEYGIQCLESLEKMEFKFEELLSTHYVQFNHELYALFTRFRGYYPPLYSYKPSASKKRDQLAQPNQVEGIQSLLENKHLPSSIPTKPQSHDWMSEVKSLNYTLVEKFFLKHGFIAHAKMARQRRLNPQLFGSKQLFDIFANSMDEPSAMDRAIEGDQLKKIISLYYKPEKFQSFEDFLIKLNSATPQIFHKVSFGLLFKAVFKKIYYFVGLKIYRLKKIWLPNRLNLEKLILDSNFRSIMAVLELKKYPSPLIEMEFNRVLHLIRNKELDWVQELCAAIACLRIALHQKYEFQKAIAIALEIIEKNAIVFHEIFPYEMIKLCYALMNKGEKQLCLRASKTYNLMLDQSAKKILKKGNKQVILQSLYCTTIGYIAGIAVFIKKQLLTDPTTKVQLAINRNRVANPCLLEYLQPFVNTIEEPNEVEKVDKVYATQTIVTALEYNGQVMDYYDGVQRVQTDWDQFIQKPLLKLHEAHIEQGLKKLEAMGMPSQCWFVALHVRESGFHNNVGEKLNSERNGAIVSYHKAIKQIIEAGGWVVRIGDPSMTPIPEVPQVIDYAHSPHKSDWMDIFLMAYCQFMISTHSGPLHVPGLFGTPCLHTNFVPIGNRPPYSHDFLLPRILRNKKTNRDYTFREMLSSCLAHAQNYSYVNAYDAYAVPNTPDELADATFEMINRCRNNYSPTPEENLLQQHFQSLCKEVGLEMRVTIPTSFLKKHQHLLQDTSRN